MKINYYLKKPLYTEKQELLKKISEILIDNHYLNIIDNVIHFKSKPKGSGSKGICLSGEIYIIKTDGLFKISWFYSEKLFISYSIGILLSMVGLYYLGDFSIPVRKWFLVFIVLEFIYRVIRYISLMIRTSKYMRMIKNTI